ncbi:MAG TPA: hypothetical protein VLS90_21775, partial [Thermodesulfobacteriota bacterium]|nr:hypothetical protein [Thermodesulfobacteriota bacterium]
TRPIEALCEAMWTDSPPWMKENYIRCGLKFVEISKEDLEELRKYLTARMSGWVPLDLSLPVDLMPAQPNARGKSEGDPPKRGEDGGKEKPSSKRKQDACGEDAKAEEEAKFPVELISEVEEHFSDVQRKNLYNKILEMPVPERQRLALLANRETRNFLIRDPNKMVSLNVLRNSKVNEIEVLQYAQRRDLAQEVILAISQDHRWRKSYSIVLALVCNPKTPLSLAAGFVPNLHDRDLKALCRDTNVSSLLRKRAQDVVDRKAVAK